MFLKSISMFAFFSLVSLIFIPNHALFVRGDTVLLSHFTRKIPIRVPPPALTGYYSEKASTSGMQVHNNPVFAFPFALEDLPEAPDLSETFEERICIKKPVIVDEVLNTEKDIPQNAVPIDIKTFIPPPPPPQRHREPKGEKKKLTNNNTINVNAMVVLGASNIIPVVTPIKGDPLSELKQNTASPETLPYNFNVRAFNSKDNYVRDKYFKYFPFSYFKKLYSIYVAIDTEATGLGNKHKLTEIAAVKMQNFQPTGEFFHTHLNPNRSVSSSAHKLTGYTWDALRDQPLFTDISCSFSRFIGTHPLLFHNAHFDCKLIDEAMRAKHPTHRALIETNAIVDSQRYANIVFPNEKNGLKNLASRFGVSSLLQDQMHGALSDTIQLVHVFRHLLQTHHSKFYNKPVIQWDYVKDININDTFEPVMHSDGELFFRERRIPCEIPPTFRYSYNLFHPINGKNLPAIISQLVSFSGEVTGYYVRFVDKPGADPYLESCLQKKFVFGSEENGLVPIFDGDPSVILVGGVVNALHAHAFFRESEFSETISKYFPKAPTIKAFINIRALPSVSFPATTKAIFVVLDSPENKLSDSERKALSQLIEIYALPQFYPILSFLNITNWEGHTVKYLQENWQVEKDQLSSNKRFLTLSRPYEQNKLLVIDLESMLVYDDTNVVENPNSNVLISKPAIEIRAIRIKSSDFGLDHLKDKQDYYNQIQTRIEQQGYLRVFKDLQFIETCEEARCDYMNALPIDDNSPVKKYFQKRGIEGELPKEFRYMKSVYHPGLEKKYPATLIPLYNDNQILVGVHRLFCGEDGERLPKQNKLPPKLSLGRTAGAAFEIYRYQNHPSSIHFISEGFENALVARDALLQGLASKENKTQLFEKFGIEHSFSIKACVGVNGLIDIPFDRDIHSVVIMADNDGNNIDVNRTIKLTVSSFLKRKLRVYIAVPEATRQHKKPDLNDVYFVNGRKRPDVVLNVLLNAVQVKKLEELGGDETSLEDAMDKLRSKNPRKITKQSLDTLLEDLEDFFTGYGSAFKG